MRIKLSWFLALVAVLSITACTSTPEERPSQRQNSQISQSLFDYSDSQIEQFLVRGATTQSMITARFGQPRGMSQSGDYIYWHYIERYQREDGRNGLAILNVVFDRAQIVVDYDFQVRHFSDY